MLKCSSLASSSPKDVAVVYDSYAAKPGTKSSNINNNSYSNSSNVDNTNLNSSNNINLGINNNNSNIYKNNSTGNNYIY